MINSKVKARAKPIAAVLALIAALSVCADQDIEAQNELDLHYCEMVKQNAWPDYKNINCG